MRVGNSIPVGVLMNWFGLVVRIGVSFALMPFVARHLGTEGYGEYLWLVAVFGYSAVLDFGFRAAILRYVGTLGARGEWERLSAIFSLILRYYAVIAATLVALGALAWWLRPAWLSPSGASDSFYRYLFLSSLVAASFFFRIAFQAFVQARERFDLASGIDLLGTACRATLVVVLLSRGGGVAQVIWADIAEALLCAVAGYLCSRRIVPNLKISLWRRAAEDRSDVVRYGLWAFVNSLAFHLRFRAPNIVVGASLGMHETGLFGVATRVQSYVFQLGTSMNSPFRSRIAILEGVREREALHAFVLFGTRVMGAVAVTVCTTLIFSGRDLFRLWMGPEFEISGAIMAVLLIALAVEISQLVLVGALYSIGRLRGLSVLSLFEGVALASMGFLFAGRHGVVGAAWGVALPLILSKLTLMPLLASRSIGVSVVSIWVRGLLRPYLAGVCAAPLLRLLAQHWSVQGLPELLARMSVFGLVVALIVLVVAFSPSELRRAIGKGVELMRALRRRTPGAEIRGD